MSLKKTMTLFLLAMFCVISVEAGIFNKVKTLWSGDQEHQSKIKILIADKIDDVELEIRGGYNIYDPNSGKKISTRFLGKKNTVEALENGLKWGEEFPGIYQLSFVPDSADTDIFIDGIKYEGSVQFFQIKNKISIVNEVNVESYLTSILADEIQDRQYEASSAMIIAARTEAYYHIAKGKRSFWHVDGSEIGYRGYIEKNDYISDLINKTNCMVMVREPSSEKYFAARWTENCAGKTAPFYIMFRKDMGAPEEGVESPWALKSRAEHQWNIAIPKEEMAMKLSCNKIDDIKVYCDNFSGKVYNLRFITDVGYKDLSFFEFQELFGAENIVSSDFTLYIDGDQVILKGYGKGHGVGICLYTAEELAGRGRNAAQILKVFFTDVNIVKTTI